MTRKRFCQHYEKFWQHYEKDCKLPQAARYDRAIGPCFNNGSGMFSNPSSTPKTPSPLTHRSDSTGPIFVNEQPFTKHQTVGYQLSPDDTRPSGTVIREWQNTMAVVCTTRRTDKTPLSPFRRPTTQLDSVSRNDRNAYRRPTLTTSNW